MRRPPRNRPVWANAIGSVARVILEVDPVAQESAAGDQVAEFIGGLVIVGRIIRIVGMRLGDHLTTAPQAPTGSAAGCPFSIAASDFGLSIFIWSMTTSVV